MRIAITGGSGLIGMEISRHLMRKGHEVIHFSRNPGKGSEGITDFYWDPDKGEIDEQALVDCSGIVNLAGAPVNRRWTPQYKSEILRSRVDSTRLLFESIQKNAFPVKTLVSASAVGYYPDDYTRTFTEKDAPGNNFLSTVCQKWEQEAQNFEKLGIRTIRYRIGLVLSKEGGLLPKMMVPFKFGLGAPLGNGRQWMSWIHISDLASLFVLALEMEDMKGGAYNACSPSPVTNLEFSKTLAKVLGKPFFLPKVPAFVLKLALGEMAESALSSNKVSSTKVESAGFRFRYPLLNEALKEELRS